MSDEQDRVKRICKKYGLTESQYYILLGNKHCPICLKPYSSTRLPCVDENHVDGDVRGICCMPCNWAIGERHNNADWFARVADYLNHPPAHALIGKQYVPGSIGASRV